MIEGKLAAGSCAATAFVLATALFAAPNAQSVAAAETGASPYKVTIDNFTFTPAEITVPAGATITFVNGDDIPHVVAAVNKTFRSKAMDTDDVYSFTFAMPGVYDYFCALHPHMQGKVIVK
jgi:plastocyanin